MRILSISAQKPDGTGSGVYLSETVAAFARSGHAVAVVAGVDVADAPALPEGCSFFPVRFNTSDLPFDVCGMSDVMPYPSTRYKDLTPSMVAQFEEAFIETIGRVVDEFCPDLVVCHHLYLVTALAVQTVRSRKPACRIVAVCHSTDLRQMASHDLERRRIVEGVRRLDRICALHEAQAAQIVATYGVDGGRVEIVGTGYNDRVFRRLSGDACAADPAAADPAAPVAVGPVDPPSPAAYPVELCFVGKVSRAKGVMSLLRAMRSLPYGKRDLRLRVVGGSGSASELEQARELVAAAPCTVELCGRVDTSRVVQIYNQSQVFVLPSFYEGLPLVVIEAMACGCRVVVSDLPGVRPWLDAQLPTAPVRYVAPPIMLPGTVDDPDPGDLPRFEDELATQIGASIGDAMREGRCAVDVSGLTWDAVARRIAAS